MRRRNDPDRDRRSTRVGEPASSAVQFVPSHGRPLAIVEGHMITGQRFQVPLDHDLGDPRVHGGQTTGVGPRDHLDLEATGEAIPVIADATVSRFGIPGPGVAWVWRDYALSVTGNVVDAPGAVVTRAMWGVSG